MRVKNILAGLSALAVAAVLTACSAGTTGSTGDVRLAAGTPSGTAAESTAPAPSTSDTPVPVKPAKAKAVQPQQAAGVPCAVTAKACVDLSAHKAWLVDDGRITYGPVPIMPGKKGSTTPLGTWHVLAKEKLHLSREFNNAPMPNSVFFYNGVAFHAGSLSNFSNGCVHLSTAASLKFFSTLAMGDEVQVVR
ncbi:L,D-transpeptidase [Amycolatopsis sp. H20-H5]|uniref:L,D-transpeptidase n=1 Tax=Amycolatopsis sp. H20-H5 TaxID=3046309 RepID=UPI002DBABB6C|nr:L,D-transpeptidase family protein [Amycolatopsis sp. H20-H5]MEC3975162.1 L,D-transpeptidase family protein [Amycolatopsis sp. H20-H5]